MSCIFHIFNCFSDFRLSFRQREPAKKTTAAEKGKIILSGIRKVINTRFPDLFDRFNQLPDPRKHQQYQMVEIMTGALFMHLFKEPSRNAYNNDRREACFRKNFFRYFKFHLPQADAVDEVLRELPPGELETLKAHLVSGLIEQKILRKFRFLGKSYMVAVDATGLATFKHRHCEHCLTKTSSKTGVVTYFHYVPEAKIVTSAGAVHLFVFGVYPAILPFYICEVLIASFVMIKPKRKLN